MSRGFVYVLTNESMPSLVKIGLTTRSVSQRANELFQTGVPTPFEIYAEYECPDCSWVEQAVHSQLSECRVSEGREFFVCPPEKAAKAIMDCQREQVEEWLSDFMPGYSLEASEFCLDPSDSLIMATHLGVSAEVIVQSYSYMMPEDLRPALQRMQAHASGEQKMEWLRPVIKAETDA